MKVQLHGARELKAALHQLPKRIGRGVLTRALHKSARPMVDEAKALVPVDTGGLRDSIVAGIRLSPRQRRRRAKGGEGEAFVGPQWPEGAHGHLVEFGTVDSRAKPFMTPAFETTKETVLNEFTRLLRLEIEKAVKRLSRRK